MATAAFITSENGWAAGEARGPYQETIEAEADGAISAGDMLRVSGYHADTGILIVKPPGGTNSTGTILGIALYDAADNEMTQVLIKGVIKLKADADSAIAVGGLVGNHNNKPAPYVVSDTGHAFGTALSAAAAGDKVLVFVGVGNA